jgi:hypothetical protein
MSMTPVFPAIRYFIEWLCCLDLAKVFDEKIKIPPRKEPDKFTCATMPEYDMSWDRIKDPFTRVVTTWGRKLPFLFDFFGPKKDEPTDTGGWFPPDVKDVIGQPPDTVKRIFADIGVPVFDVDKSPDIDFIDIFKAYAKVTPGKPVTLVERNGKVVNVTDRISTRDVGPIRKDVERAVADAGEAKSRVEDVGEIRSVIDTLRLKVEESRKLIDERDTTIRTLTENLDKLNVELKDSRRMQKESAERIETLSTKTAAIDELKANVERLLRRPPIG